MTGWAGYGHKAAAAAAVAATTHRQPGHGMAAIELVVGAAAAGQASHRTSRDPTVCSATGGGGEGVLNELQFKAASTRRSAAAAWSHVYEPGRGNRKQEQRTPEPVTMIPWYRVRGWRPAL